MNLFDKIMITGLLTVQAFFCGSAQTRVDRNSFGYLQQQFEKPDKQFGSAPLWVWNTNVTHALIDSMLTGFKKQSFGGVFVHPRPGLITPYLSKEWFALWDYAMKKAKALDMDIWISDENSYPSGFAGGHVPAEMPSSYNQAQMLGMKKADLLPDSSQYFIALKKGKGDVFTRVDKKTKPGANGDFYLFEKVFYYQSPWYGGYSYVDLMVPGVTEKFIDLTMRKGYEPVVGNEFGKTVKGLFSDEPNIESWDGKSIRWTPLLFSTFKQRWGYNLEENLPSLFEETGDWKKVRHNYYSILLYLFIEHWSKPMNKYATEKNLEWTGHYWEHEWPSLMHGPDNMAMYAWHQRPGIDMLFNQFNEYSHEAQFGNIRSVKELASVANQLGKKRTLSETYGGGGWELTFKDMKRLGDWEFVLGINTLNQHLAYMSMEGARKYDYPQSFSYHNPWFPYYGNLNKHFARLSLALSTGLQKNNILILEPTTTAWMYYRFIDSNQLVYKTGQDFQSFITRLEKSQVEYDLGSEDIIRRNGSVKGKQFVIGQAAYKTVVIPAGTENINSATFALLKKFKSQGGQVLVFDTLLYVDGKKDASLAKWVINVPRFNGLHDLNEALVNNYFSDPSLHFEKTDTTVSKLYHQRRQLPGGQILLLVNSSIDHPLTGKFHINGKSVALLQTQTGNITGYPAIQKEGVLEVDYTLPAAGSLLFFIANQTLKLPAPLLNHFAATNELPTGTSVSQRLRPNILTLDFCDLQLNDTMLLNHYFYEATDYLFKHRGFNDGDPWNTSVQFNDNTIKRDTFKTGSGFVATYHFTMDDSTARRDLKLVIEHAALWSVTVNGTRVKPLDGAWYFDKNFSVLPIGEATKKGINTVTLTAPRMSVYAEIEPVYVLGNFDLVTDTAAWRIIAAKPKSLGSWKEQGMPLYGHEMVYSKSFTATAATKSYWLQPGKWKGTVALLKVNNRQVAILLGNEEGIDISPYVRPGSNEVQLIITGSFKNTLGPHYYKPPPGLVSPWHWRYVYKQIPGSEYDLYDYGLMDDFHIYANP